MINKTSLFDTLLEPVFVLNKEQKITYCNEAASLMAGLSIRKMTRGMKFLEVFSFNESIESLESLESIQDPTPYKELNFKNGDGLEGKVQITLQPYATENDSQWIVFFRDVTLEERLQKKYRAELEQKEDVISDLEKAKAQLEDYSKNLESMVAKRTEELSTLNQTLSALLDSLGQGFFIFQEDGNILNVSSKACESVLETNPQGQKIWDVLKLPANKVDGFQKWMLTVFQELLPFEDLAPLGPELYPHTQGKHVALEYHPLRNSENQIKGVVVVASDITSLVEARKTAEQEKEHAKLIINMIKSKREIQRFISEADSLLADLNEELQHDDPQFDHELVFRSLHTLKGGAALFSILPLAECCHQGEQILSELHHQWSLPGHIALKGKVFEIRDEFEKFLSETKAIIGKNNVSDERQVEVAISKLNTIAKKLGNLPGGGPLAQELLLDLAMEPVENYFTPFRESLPRLAEKLGKNLGHVEINTHGIGVIPEIYNPLFSTFIHAFRNSLDHGLEYPEERSLLGKTIEGTLKLEASLLQEPSGSWLRIEIKDDGRGIDPAIIRQKLEKNGLSSQHLSDEDVLQHIFASQFSTREEVTDISGRGVGMDALKVAAEQLHGRVWVESALQKGTTICIQVPYITEFVDKEKKKSQEAA
ncbi:chemotaxis histidine kinase [Bdellovibrio bacteriovorus W]|nr:chemotaxis histidine kinase [Bdellovibrio bacteriovorus W]